MRAILPLLFLLFSRNPAFLPAQPSAGFWRLEVGSESTAVPVANHHGYAAIPVGSLLSMGARVSYGRGQASVRLGGTELLLRVDSAHVLAGGTAHALPNRIYSADGVIYAPVELLSLVLPVTAAGLVSVDPQAQVVRADAAAIAAALAAPPSPPAPAPPPVEAAPPGRRLVVIDAGHGGRDPGAQGPSGTREKDINLSLARRLAALLAEDATLEVRLTRSRDTLIALRDRGRLANSWRAEGQPALFISIHCNAHSSRAEQGFETYFLSEARTADARRVQEFEDGAVQYEEQRGPSAPLAFIMNDLRQNQYLRESSDWAQMIQDRLREVHPGPNRGVKQAGFAVLVGAFMPAVLVEVGFISNREEEQMLVDPRQQDTLARQLARGVQDYFAASERRSAVR